MTDIKKKLGFGCMRLPMLNGEVDTTQTCAMVDAFLNAGFNYFDTAHGYLNGKLRGLSKVRQAGYRYGAGERRQFG